jgi:hypothetical protein
MNVSLQRNSAEKKTMATSKKAKKPTLQERQVLALERIANVLETVTEYIEKSGLPIALSTSWADGSIFPLDVFVHQERPKGRPSDRE